MVGSNVPKEWDHETDVLIVGAGTAGLPAAIAAAEAGAEVTVLESTSRCGGSGSLIIAGASFAGTEWQRKAGVEDSPDLLYKDGVDAGGDPGLWRVYADNQVDTFNWLMSIGVKPWRDDFMKPPGFRLARLHHYKGAAAMEKIEARAKELKKIEILMQHRAQRLITDTETGRVLGVRINAKNKTFNFKARKAVVLATGGFGRNREMIKEYGERYIDCIPIMPPGHQGDGLKMALDLGAATKDIGHAVVSSLPVCVDTKSDRSFFTIVLGGILVNLNGRRFYNESCPVGYYGNMTDAAIDEPEGTFFAVYDDRIRSIPVVLEAGLETCKEYKGDTLEELAKTLGIDPAAFAETVKKYNEDIESEGYDTVLGRKYLQGTVGPPPVTLDTPPYYAVKCKPSLTSFKGGIKINTRCQVVNNYGEIIPGLYAIGEVAGGLIGKDTYLGGLMWPASMTFGRLVGRNVAFEKF
jgi:fumarate reductase flavoprotein subunit